MFIHESGSLGNPTIVFLHGNGANGSMWQTHMEVLTEFHCLAPDFPGFGQSRDQEWIRSALHRPRYTLLDCP
jgi:pimeloyl-ACP methyl ester carboxylesterase